MCAGVVGAAFAQLWERLSVMQLPFRCTRSNIVLLEWQQAPARVRALARACGDVVDVDLATTCEHWLPPTWRQVVFSSFLFASGMESVEGWRDHAKSWQRELTLV